MVITVKQAYNFQLFGYVASNDTNPNLTISGYRYSAVLLVQCRAWPGFNITVPDWVSFNTTFLAAVAAGTATVVTSPTGTTTLTATETSSNILLPVTGKKVVVSNPLSATNAPVSVALGDSAVTVAYGSNPVINAGSSIILPLGSATYLAAISGQPSSVLNIAVI